MSKRSSKDAIDIFYNSTVIDCLAGTTFEFDALRDANITAANITIAAHNEGFSDALDRIKDYYAAIQTHDDTISLIRTIRDIERAKADKRTGLILGFQTASPIENDLSNLGIFSVLGIRIIQLTYMGRNLVGDGCYEEPDRGLTYFGRTLVREMNRLGIVIDLSHSGWNTASMAIDESLEPVILSHSNPYEICPNSRNVPTSMIKAVAEKGGVIGINGHPALCMNASGERPTISDYLDVLEYTVKQTSVDHVGIGPDLFEGFQEWQAFRWDARYDELDTPWSATNGLSREADIIDISKGLFDRGFDEISIQKILGLNFLRVFQRVWKDNLPVSN